MMMDSADLATRPDCALVGRDDELALVTEFVARALLTRRRR